MNNLIAFQRDQNYFLMNHLLKINKSNLIIIFLKTIFSKEFKGIHSYN